VVAKLYKFASVPRRDLLSIELVVMGVDGNTGPNTSPVIDVKKMSKLNLPNRKNIILTTQSNRGSRTAVNVSAEFGVRNDGRLFNGNVEKS
jgi:hypothetical protein